MKTETNELKKIEKCPVCGQACGLVCIQETVLYPGYEVIQVVKQGTIPKQGELFGKECENENLRVRI